MSLKNYTISDLQAEIQRRKSMIPEAEYASNIDPEKLSELKDSCVDYIKMIFTEYHEDKVDDYENDIFEKALGLFYGENIWNKINEQIL
jgi:hypothetical protein